MMWLTGETIPKNTVCLLGRTSLIEDNVTCISCQRQDVECPFPTVTRVKHKVITPLGVVPISANGPIKELRSPGRPAIKEKTPSAKRKPNNTELTYSHILELEFPDCSVRFESVTFNLENGHKYTPDLIVRVLPDGGTLCVEVKARGKSGYRHPSYQRARIAFDQSRLEWPDYYWRWAENNGDQWIVENYTPIQRTAATLQG